MTYTKGEVIRVRDHKAQLWRDAIFLEESDEGYVCVQNTYREKYEKGLPYRSITRKEAQEIK